jgi:molecular chaperone GrpE (heat shock protein)
MIIDLTDPLTIAIFSSGFIGILILGITGVIKFSVITHQKKLIEDSFFRLRAEVELIQKENQKEVSKLKQINKEKMTNTISQTLDLFDRKITTLLEHNKPPTGRTLMDRSMFEKILTKKNS